MIATSTDRVQAAVFAGWLIRSSAIGTGFVWFVCLGYKQNVYIEVKMIKKWGKVGKIIKKMFGSIRLIQNVFES